MISFQTVYEEALFRQGDEATLKAKLPVPKNKDELRSFGNNDYLSVMELDFLKGREKLSKYQIHSLIHY